REIEMLRALKHPHILPIIADGVDGGTSSLYMILPYLPGGSLSKRLTSGAPRMTLAEVERLLGQIASAMDYAYTHTPNERILHRDIKPDNILLDDKGQAYLADFSIARLMDESRSHLTHTGANPGTYAYMSPEARLGEADLSLASDIYSLGLVAYEMVTGQRRPATGEPPSPRTLNRDLPVPAAEVILRALRRDPAERFATATAFAQAFSRGLRGEWPTGMAPTVAGGWPSPTPSAADAQTVPDGGNLAQPVRSVRSRSLVALLGGAVALLAIGGLVGVSILSHSVFFAAPQPGGGSGASVAKALASPTHTATKPRATPTTHHSNGHPSGGTTTIYVSGGGGGGGAAATDTPTPRPTATATPSPTPTYTPVPPPPPTYTPVPPPPSPSIQIGWSTTHPQWIWMTLSNFSTGAYQYTCHFSGGALGPYSFTVYYQPETWDNGQTCQTGIANNHLYVTIGSVTSNTIVYP
ncbi:MAG TPA: serine/threonine-protein kinase, partial [Ktedonobacterales bacterium]